MRISPVISHNVAKANKPAQPLTSKPSAPVAKAAKAK